MDFKQPNAAGLRAIVCREGDLHEVPSLPLSFILRALHLSILRLDLLPSILIVALVVGPHPLVVHRVVQEQVMQGGTRVSSRRIGAGSARFR